MYFKLFLLQALKIHPGVYVHCKQLKHSFLCEIAFEICCLCIKGNRDENQTVDYQKAQEDAQRLYQAGEGKLGTDESCFNMVLASRSFPQLKATVEAYSRVGILH